MRRRRSFFAFPLSASKEEKKKKKEKIVALSLSLLLSLFLLTVASPTARATTFFSVPAISTPTLSAQALTTKLSVENSRTKSSAVAGLAAATVASVKPPRATSSAMLAPIKTAVSTPRTRSTMAEISCGPSGRTLMPFISERATVL